MGKLALILNAEIAKIENLKSKTIQKNGINSLVTWNCFRNSILLLRWKENICKNKAIKGLARAIMRLDMSELSNLN